MDEEASYRVAALPSYLRERLEFLDSVNVEMPHLVTNCFLPVPYRSKTLGYNLIRIFPDELAELFEPGEL